MKKVLQLLTLTTLLATSLSAASIHDAVRAGTLAEVERLINEDPACVNAKGDFEMTPLHCAVEQGRTEIAMFLLAHGAEVNARSGGSYTPLHGAANRGHTEIVRFLLAYGAKVNAKNAIGWTPLHLAVIDGYTAIVESLLENGADVNVGDFFDNQTPLDIARVHGHIAVLERLVMIPLLKSLRELSASELVTMQ